MNSETGTYSPSIPPLAIRKARVDSNNRDTDDAISRKLSRSRTTEKDRRVNKRTIPTSKRVSTTNLTSFAEKDFIVFSIKEDGTFDIAKDGGSRTSDCQDDRGLRSLRSVNIELKSRGEQEASVQECNGETSTGGSQVLVPYDEDDQEESMCLEEDDHFGSTRTGFQMEGDGDCTRASTELRDSGQSDGSADSFTFPVLHDQWIGSPVKMPRSEDLSLRKATASCFFRFKCCKF
ncbi:hypothetical protein BT93_K0137 [Corymbia citriodora subsp. variegata]|nr:hypothetical protein BT93_K0137 [Corymbia citriodora subsp. variegata]